MGISGSVVNPRYLAVVHTLVRALLTEDGNLNRKGKAGTEHRARANVGAEYPVGYDGQTGLVPQRLVLIYQIGAWGNNRNGKRA